MSTVRAGSQTLCSSLATVVSGAGGPSARANIFDVVFPVRMNRVANHSGVGGAGGVPYHRQDVVVEDTDLGLHLSECGWLGRRVWLEGRSG